MEVGIDAPRGPQAARLLDVIWRPGIMSRAYMHKKIKDGQICFIVFLLAGETDARKDLGFVDQIEAGWEALRRVDHEMLKRVAKGPDPTFDIAPAWFSLSTASWFRNRTKKRKVNGHRDVLLIAMK